MEYEWLCQMTKQIKTDKKKTFKIIVLDVTLYK